MWSRTGHGGDDAERRAVGLLDPLGGLAGLQHVLAYSCSREYPS